MKSLKCKACKKSAVIIRQRGVFYLVEFTDKSRQWVRKELVTVEKS